MLILAEPINYSETKLLLRLPTAAPTFLSKSIWRGLTTPWTLGLVTFYCTSVLLL